MIDTAEKFRQIVGWYDDGDQAAHDPSPLGSLCMACELPMTRPMRTVCVMYAEDAKRSYFYRVHAPCAVPDEDLTLDEKLFDAVEAFHMEDRRVQ